MSKTKNFYNIIDKVYNFLKRTQTKEQSIFLFDDIIYICFKDEQIEINFKREEYTTKGE